MEICHEESAPDEIRAVSCLAYQKIAKACFPIKTCGLQTDTHVLDVKDSYVIHTSQINACGDWVFEKASSRWSSHEGGLWSCLSDRICMFLLHAVLIYNICLSKLHMAVSRPHIQDHNQDNWSFHIVLIDCLWLTFVCNWQQWPTANLDPLPPHLTMRWGPTHKCMDDYVRD